MTKADEMRKLAAQNQKPKTQKVDYYDEALRRVYFDQFINTNVSDCAQRGDSSGVGYLPCELRTPPHSDSDYDNGICVGKLYEDKIKGFFTTYHVITVTSLGERFLRDFKAKAGQIFLRFSVCNRYGDQRSGRLLIYGKRKLKRNNSRI